MLRIAKKTRLAPQEVIARAITFFGDTGRGLTETSRDTGCVSFEGGGGHVVVSVRTEGSDAYVDLETSEFEYEIKQFLQSV